MAATIEDVAGAITLLHDLRNHACGQAYSVGAKSCR